MKKIRRSLIISAVVCVMLSGCSEKVPVQTSEETKPVTEATESVSRMEEEILRLMNVHRTEADLPELSADPGLYECALIRAREAEEKWSHRRPDGSSYDTVFEQMDVDLSGRSYGENLAKDFSTAEEAVAALMQSREHRENILREQFESVAIAVVPTENGYFTLAQEFLGS